MTFAAHTDLHSVGDPGRDLEGDAVFFGNVIQSSKDGEEVVQSVVARRFEELRCKVQTLKLLPTRLSLEKEFAAEETIDMTERVSVMGRLPGTGSGRSILLFGHPDGEPMTDGSLEGWEHDPFAAEVDSGRVYGWGGA